MGRRNAESSPCPGEPQIKPPHEQHITAGTPAGGPKKPSLLLQYATEKPSSLLDPLLALLGVGVPRRAQAALVPGHERAEQRVFPDLGDGLLVALGHVRARVELGPVDL